MQTLRPFAPSHSDVQASPDLEGLGYDYDNIQRELDRTPNHTDRWHVLMDRAEKIRRRARR